ncbi:hypothetical protein DL96DRAFT_1613518 [Flagelloscypha sp. PMI_526]|nr:hypothetical protein DL96DRAFT_1613518 [Flagelloscypha sp. PMI_526]
MATIPVELLQSHIIPHFHAGPNDSTTEDAVLTLKNLSLACRLFHRMAQPFLFERVIICESSKSTVEDLHHRLSFFLDTPRVLMSIHTVFLHFGVFFSGTEDSVPLMDKISFFLQKLPGLKVLRLDNHWLKPWSALPPSITAVLVDHVLPKLITLDVSHIVTIPFINIVANAPLLEHILLWQWDPEEIPDLKVSEEDKKAIRYSRLRSLTIDSYLRSDFGPRSSLLSVLDLLQGKLECVIVLSRIGGMVDANDDSFGHLNGLFSHCKPRLKHLHLGPEIWEKVELDSDTGTPDAESIDISSFTELDTLQVEFSSECKSISTGGSPFSKWLTKNMDGGTNIRILIFDIPAPLPTTKAYEDGIWRDLQLPWIEMDSALTQMPAFRKFRVRLQRPSRLDSDAISDQNSDASSDTEGSRTPPPPPIENPLIEFENFFKHALPLCAERGAITTEWWDDPKSLVNTAVLERAAT